MQVLAELVGTFILMFSVCGIIACTQLSKGEVGLLEYAATAGLTVVVVIFSIGHISCAHVNPAVTIAFATFGHFPWSKVHINSSKSCLPWCLGTESPLNSKALTCVTGSALHIGTNVGFCVGNMYWTVCVQRQIGNYDHPAAQRLQLRLLGGAYCDIYHHVSSCFSDLPT
jgi:hypothetical protein